jgi:3-oxoacyl-[acyl-carrier-protein] synthase-3
MHRNTSFTFDDVAVISVVACHAPEIVTSAEFDARLADSYNRLGGRPGLLERLAGVRERRWWPEGTGTHEPAALAGAKAIAESGVDTDAIGLLIDSSVDRDRLEPSSACTVHHVIGLSSSCISFDLSNACLGFVNAMHMAGAMIDAGHIDYALVVDGENSRHIQEPTLERLSRPDATKEDFRSEFATLTLGSGAAAMVIGRHSENPGSHRMIRGGARSATEHHELCVGSLEKMRTDLTGLLEAGVALAKESWDAASEPSWQHADRYVMHQVSTTHTAMVCKQLGIDPAKAPLTFPMFGNVGPASIPITLAGEVDSLQSGDRVICMGVASGLNAAAIEIVW